jgi:hypothetical protein
MTAEQRLGYAFSTVAILRHLEATDTTMRYNELGRVIGLIGPDERFNQGHRTQIADILNLAAVADSKVGALRLDFDRIVRADGKPGAGFFKTRKLTATLGRPE